MTVSKGALVAKLNTDPAFGTTEEERQKVRRLAAESALRQKRPAEDLTRLLGMLGLRDMEAPPKPRRKSDAVRPAKPKPRPVTNIGRCANPECRIPIYPQGTEVLPGGKRHGGRGMCTGCYAAVRRAEKKAAAQ